ncbi:MAG: hypothetical protein Q8J65_10290 [Nitrosomonadales bacterium]|nr:hypothetical protein [Nitrosomonadales bacterium]
MGKEITGVDGPVFGISSSKDMFEKLKYESLDLQKNWLNTYTTFNFLVTAWHLFEDWKKSDDPRSLSRIKRQKKKLPSEMILVLDVIRDLVNGSKHFKLTPEAVKNRRVTYVHTGKEVGWYDFFFHENLPAVTVDGHWYLSIRLINNIAMSYFEWVFDDTSSVKHFPTDLLQAINYCNIARHPQGPSPRIWLIGIDDAYSS